MDARRVALGFVAVLAVIGGAIALARTLPPQHADVVVTSKAAEAPARGAHGFTAVRTSIGEDLLGAWSSGTSVFAVGQRGRVVRVDDPALGAVGEESGTERDLFAVAGRPNGAIVVVGAHGTILQRALVGGAWGATPPGFDDDLFGVLLDDDGAMVVGAHGRIARAIGFVPGGGVDAPPGPPGGWATEDSGTKSELRAIARDGAGYVAVGAGGTIATCARVGAPWALAKSPTRSDLFAVAIDRGVAYAVGDAGTILKRDALGVWSFDASGSSSRLRALTAAAGTLFALGEDGTILRLANGRWLPDRAAPGAPLAAIAVRLDALWVFGAHGGVAERRLF